MKWKPIETAKPKVADCALLWTDAGLVIGVWTNDWFGLKRAQGWIDMRDGRRLQPTHCMPLPDPPPLPSPKPA